MSKEAGDIVTRMKHFAFLLRISARDVSDLTSAAGVRTEVSNLPLGTSKVLGDGIETNVTKAEFEAFMKTLDDFKTFMQGANTNAMSAILKGL